MGNTVEDVVKDWCRTISVDIAERRFYDIKEIEAYASVKLKTAITECLKIQLSDLEIQRKVWTIKFNRPGISGQEDQKIKAILAELNFKIKEHNRFLEKQRDEEDMKKLHRFLVDKFGKDIVSDWWAQIRKK